MYKGNNIYGKYFNPKKGGNEPKHKHILKQIWKWSKIVLILFVIISVLWGCVQMYQPEYSSQGIIDMTGSTVVVPGTAFEIITSILGQNGGQTFNGNAGDISSFGQYGSNIITNWGEAWTVTGSPFYGLFVYPIALLLNAFIWLFNPNDHLNPTIGSESRNAYGIAVLFAIIMVVIVIQGVSLAATWKSQKNTAKMQDMQLKQAEIREKYKDKKDPASRQKQQMEMQALSKKEGMSPFASLGSTILTMPIFIALIGVVRSSLSLKIASIGQISLIDQPWQKATGGEPIYISLILVYLPLQAVSMFLPTLLQMISQKGKILTEAQKKARRRNLIMQGVMAVMMIFWVSSVASGVAIYWIFSSALRIIQTLGFHFYNKRSTNSGSQERERRIRQMKKQKTIN